MFGIVRKYFLISWLNPPGESARPWPGPGGVGRVGPAPGPVWGRDFVWVRLGLN